MTEKKSKFSKFGFGGLLAASVGVAGLLGACAVQGQEGEEGLEPEDSVVTLGTDTQELHSSSLVGTKCWVLEPALGKGTFLELRFVPIGGGHSLLSGQAVRNDGSKPDRVLQLSGSASRHTFVGDGDATISRFLVDLHYSFSKTGTNPANAFVETGANLLGHYNIRLNPDDLSGVFEGRDVVLDWAAPLSGPSETLDAKAAQNAYSSIANNYLGGLTCDGTVPGFDNCGTYLPINNTGTLTLVGSNRRECRIANPQL